MNWIEGENGACIGDQVSISCTVTQTGILQWALEPFFSREYRAQFDLRHTSGTVLTGQTPDVVTITLVSVERGSLHSQQGNLSSIITVRVTPTTIGKHVHCSNGYISLEESPSLIIQNTCEFASCD